MTVDELYERLAEIRAEGLGHLEIVSKRGKHSVAHVPIGMVQVGNFTVEWGGFVSHVDEPSLDINALYVGN